MDRMLVRVSKRQCKGVPSKKEIAKQKNDLKPENTLHNKGAAINKPTTKSL